MPDKPQTPRLPPIVQRESLFGDSQELLRLASDPQPVFDPGPSDEQRRVRLDVCRAAAAFQDALSGLQDHAMAAELQNMVTMTLRLALRSNDGRISTPEKMRAW